VRWPPSTGRQGRSAARARCATPREDSTFSCAKALIGEVERRGSDIGGIAVNLAARVQATAGPDEALVTRTVAELVAGPGIEFQDRGERELREIPGRWRLLELAD